MNWDAAGTIAELVGAIAIVVTLGISLSKSNIHD